MLTYLDCKHYYAITVHRCVNQENKLKLDHISSTSENKAVNSISLSSSTLILAIETSKKEFYFEYKEKQGEKWHRLATVVKMNTILKEQEALTQVLLEENNSGEIEKLNNIKYFCASNEDLT
ncbi:hypothetical protein BDB00DRAFT_873020 [Zychaea mexicana]|uniref:uncharacterized protein n=1 Tax=Zychaea mexicana TaxID=64656 RepID=UPI0022FEB28D|nr:uncharacterized protein BDB00DRAFT_873020 [Zychaea mexicana]KAI9492796.1 hypothetical protein BDB00DRAFT_873020 [Zychaea mexicana]